MKERFRNFWENFTEKLAALRSRIELQEEIPDNDVEAYKVRLRNHRKAMYVRTAFLVVFIVLAALLVKFLIDHHAYHGYAVVHSVEKTDNVSEYQVVDGKILRYSSDGAALLKEDLDTVWNVAYTMESPCVDTCQDAIVIYDRNGTTVHVYNAGGETGSFQTDLPIVKAKVSAAGNVAAILSDEQTTWIKYYTTGGSEIAAASSNMKSPGYPTDLALSQDGLFMAVSYLTVAEDSVGTHLAFYNFGEAGKNVTDNMVASEDFSGTIIPQVAFVSNDEAVAFRENGFTIYKGSGSPAKTQSVDFDDEVVSTFYDAKHIGFIFKSRDAAHKYVMKIYSINGVLLTTTNVDVIYDTVKVCGDHVLFNNSTELSVFSLDGIERFTGVLDEGDISYVLKIGWNRYLIVTDTRTETIKLT
jgi:hypothetical protein